VNFFVRTELIFEIVGLLVVLFQLLSFGGHITLGSKDQTKQIQTHIV